ncbi:MAG: SPFH domain-containing protein [Chloroflexi bacterium]|nr:SPFH domain-containing protein [Chloroflexota bacterium]
MEQRFGRGSSVNWKWIIGIPIAVVLLAIVFGLLSPHLYLFTQVEAQQVGVRFRAGRIYEVVGPGVYSDFGWYANLRKVSMEAVTFSVSDPEVVTSDRQRIGLAVSGDVFRPSIAESDVLIRLWPEYQRLYLSDELLKTRVTDLTLQAIKSCAGSRTFNDNVIGAGRDALRVCVDTEVNELASNLGLTVKNVAIPNVILSPEVQTSLDNITQSRLDTELAQQDAIKAKEQATAEQVRQEGEVRVALSRQQEEVRQQTTLAQLQRDRVLAERSVIEATKSNELLSAQKDLEINEVAAEAALAAARATLAQDIVLAEMYASNPAFAYLQAVTANASALSPTDKLIFVPEGTTPTIVVPGSGIMPTVDTAQGTVSGGTPAETP